MRFAAAIAELYPLASMRMLPVFVFLVGTSALCMALSYGTPSSMSAQAMASNMDYLRETGKKAPQTWAEMNVLFGKPMDVAFPYVLPTQRYAFLTNDVRFGDDRILLMMRSPFRDVKLYTAWYGGIAHGVRERGRWVVLQKADSIIRARYVPEDAVVDAFSRAQVPLPIPDGLGEWPHELEFRRVRKAKIIFGGIAFGLASAIFFAHRAGRANKALQRTGASVSI